MFKGACRIRASASRECESLRIAEGFFIRVQGFPQTLLGGSWDLASRVISTLIGVISHYNCTYLTYNPNY